MRRSDPSVRVLDASVRGGVTRYYIVFYYYYTVSFYTRYSPRIIDLCPCSRLTDACRPNQSRTVFDCNNWRIAMFRKPRTRLVRVRRVTVIPTITNEFFPITCEHSWAFRHMLGLRVTNNRIIISYNRTAIVTCIHTSPAGTDPKRAGSRRYGPLWVIVFPGSLLSTPKS